MKNRSIEDKGMEFAIFATGVGGCGKIAKKRFVEFAAGEAGIENFRIHASGNGGKALRVEILNKFARVAFPDGKECGHADASEILLAISAQVFEEYVAEGDLSNATVVEGAKHFFHAGFVDGI